MTTIHSYCMTCIVYSMQIFLDGYPNHWTLQEAQAASEKFVNKMKELDEQLRKRNETLEMPYKYLLPSMVPISITI